jgi:hypothetical protein
MRFVLARTEPCRKRVLRSCVARFGGGELVWRMFAVVAGQKLCGQASSLIL